MEIAINIRLDDTRVKTAEGKPVSVDREYKVWVPGSPFNERDVAKLTDVVRDLVDMESEIPEMAAELGAAVHEVLPVEDVQPQEIKAVEEEQ